MGECGMGDGEESGVDIDTLERGRCAATPSSPVKFTPPHPVAAQLPVHPIDTLRRRTPVEINTHLK